jgi:hypothetical protein
VARHKDTQWSLPEGKRNEEGGTTHTWDSINAALLMDIRDELKELNETLRVLRCRNFLLIPAVLRGIRENTTKPTRKRKKR